MEQINKRKRVTVKLSCPNPMFERWLSEWRDEAKRRESKMEHCFSNALRSLQKYPLPLETGKDCKVLRGFGDKLCNMLDEKLKDYNRDMSRTSAATTGITYNMEVNGSAAIPNINKSTDNSSRSGLKSTEKTKKEYVPQPGTGPFAILVALHKLSQVPGYVGYSSKLEIMRCGQTFCDTSFTKPEAGSRYTAWSSMRTLLQKQLVSKWSNPAKFSLTKDGTLLAVKLYSTLDSSGNRRSNECFSMDVDPDVEIINTDTYTSNNSTKSHGAALDSCKDVTFDTVIDNLASITGTYSVDSSGNRRSNECFSMDVEPDVEIINTDTYTSNNSTKSHGAALDSCKDVTFDTVIDNLASITGTYSVDTQIKPPSNKCVNRNAEAIYSKTGNLQSKTSESVPPSRSKNSKQLVSKTLSNKQLNSCAGQVSSSCQEEETVFLMPNEFDIILLVDTQETSGSKSRIDDPIIVELKKLNVQFEVRHLKVGDYTWICRHHTSNYELVLPYVIERKRMDDLGHSIKDGRFHEQKFRLKQCGIQNLVYLIENYGRNENMGLPITTLYQAALNTMVQDEFVVKIVDNIQETVSYLSGFSSLLNKYYKAKTLMSCPKENLTPSTLDDDLIPLLTFKEFSKTGTKNKQLKVTDLFVRQLLQIKGMSVEKALAIVNVYQTPKTLAIAYHGKSTGEAEKLLSSIQFGNLKKNVGPVLSKIVCQLFTMKQF